MMKNTIHLNTAILKPCLKGLDLVYAVAGIFIEEGHCMA